MLQRHALKELEILVRELLEANTDALIARQLYDPATGDVVAQVAEGDKEDIERSCPSRPAR